MERDLDRDELRHPEPALAAPPGLTSPAADDLLAARSVGFTVATPVRAEPSSASARIGIIGADARATALQLKSPGDGCAVRWIKVAPRGWVCASNAVATSGLPGQS